MKQCLRFIFVFFILFFCFIKSGFAQTPWWRLTTFQSKVDALPKEKETDLKVPVLIGITPGSFQDTYGRVYTSGSVHQGEDIFAPRGAYVVSPTEAVVTRIDTAGAGGIAVYTANPGDETFYYAHLTAVGPTIVLGAELQPGDLIGYVGNTGDAEGSSTHLHFQIFSLEEPINPYPRFTKTFSDNERIVSLEKIIQRSDNPPLAGKAIAALYKNYFLSLPKDHVALPKEIEDALPVNTVAQTPSPIVSTPSSPSVPTSSGDTNASSGISQSLSIGMKGEEVKKLQQYLIDKKTGQYADMLKGYGATGTFGRLTQAALIEFQKANAITPAVGFCGPLTRAYIAAHA